MTSKFDLAPSFFADENRALSAFNDTGFHVELDFLSAEECDIFVRASQHLKNALDGLYRPTLNPHKESDVFLRAMRNPKLITIMEKLVGGKVSGIQTQLFFGRPGTHGFAIHQDNFFVEAKPASAFVSTWLALTDVDQENGTLFVFPGAHKEGLLPVKKLNAGLKLGQDSNANNEECIVPDHYSKWDVVVPKGTLIFIHSLAPHGSYHNISSTRWRHVMLNNYIKQGTPFRSGNSAKRQEIPVYDVI